MSVDMDVLSEFNATSWVVKKTSKQTRPMILWPQLGSLESFAPESCTFNTDHSQPPEHHDYASPTIAAIYTAHTPFIAPFASTHTMPFREITTVSKKRMAARSAEALTTPPPLEGTIRSMILRVPRRECSDDGS